MISYGAFLAANRDPKQKKTKQSTITFDTQSKTALMPCYMLLTLLGDKLCNIASFDPFFKNRCSSLYQNRQQVAIDEQMLKPRHRSGIRQFIKDKPNKWGIKLWVLADSSNGYAVDLISTLVKLQGRLSGQMALDMM